MLTAFLFFADSWYVSLGSQLTLTSGSEKETVHSYTSLHYADPCCAADVRSWSFWKGEALYDDWKQAKQLTSLAATFCRSQNIPETWLEVIHEADHLHVEYQPKRT